MANGDKIAPLWKVAGLAATVSIGISGITLSILSDRITEQNIAINALHKEMTKGERYTEKDAERDFGVANARMSRIEARDERCERRMNQHIISHGR